jgi:hypothetical protein
MMKKKRANEIIRLMMVRMGVNPKIDLVQGSHLLAKRLGIQIRHHVGAPERIRLAIIASEQWNRPDGKKRILEASAELVGNVVEFKPKAKIKKDKEEPNNRKINTFYKSWEWKRLRYEFLKNSDRRCQCCGATPEDGVRLVVDHVKPIRRFWHLRLDITNLQVLCNDCNMGKGSHDETLWTADAQQMARLEAIKTQLGEG